MTPNDALQKLIEGTHRFSSGLRSVHTFLGGFKLQELAEQGQSPIATIITCSDSRMPTETIFDLGIGELFVIRTAGNRFSRELLGGIEYSVSFLGVPLVVVLGHTRCGAIELVLKQTIHPTSRLLSKNIETLYRTIATPLKPAEVKRFQDERTRKDVISEFSLRNVRSAVQDLRKNSSLLNEHEAQEKIRVMGALYHLDTGKIEFDL